MPGAIQRLIEVIVRYRLDDRFPDWADYRALAEQGLLSESLAAMLLWQTEPYVAQQIDYPNLLHRPPTAEQLRDAGKPDFEVGELVESPGLRVGLRIVSQVGHVLVAGQTGGGKTTDLRTVIAGVDRCAKIHGQPISIIAADRKGGDQADTPQLGDNWQRTSVHDGLRLGLNAPPSVPTNVWINRVTSLIGARAGLVASAGSLANEWRWLMPVLNPKQDSPLVWPSLGLLYDVLMAAPEELFSAKPEYAQTLRQALEVLTQAAGPLFDAATGLDLEQDVIATGKSVVIDMPNMEPGWLRQLAIDLLITQVITSRVHRNHKPGRLEVLFVVDEADQDVSEVAEEHFADRLAPISQIMKQGREFGVGVVLGLTRIRGASPFVLSNAQYHMIFGTGHEESVKDAAQTLLLPRGAEQILPALRPGQCLFRQTGSWPHAMLVQLDNTPAPKSRPAKSFDALPFTPAFRLADRPDIQQALRALVAEFRRGVLQRRRSASPDISKPARTLLDLAALHLCTPVTQLWKKVSTPSASVQLAARKELERLKLARFEEPRIGSTRLLLIELLPAGWALLGKPPPARTGRGTITHRQVAAWIADVERRAGRTHVQLEWLVPGTNHPVDVASPGGDLRLFEVVVTCEANLVASLTSCFASTVPVGCVTVVALQRAILDEVRQVVLAAPQLAREQARIKFEVADTYLRELWP